MTALDRLHELREHERVRAAPIESAIARARAAAEARKAKGLQPVGIYVPDEPRQVRVAGDAPAKARPAAESQRIVRGTALGRALGGMITAPAASPGKAARPERDSTAAQRMDPDYWRERREAEDARAEAEQAAAEKAAANPEGGEKA